MVHKFALENNVVFEFDSRSCRDNDEKAEREQLEENFCKDELKMASILSTLKTANRNVRWLENRKNGKFGIEDLRILIWRLLIMFFESSIYLFLIIEFSFVILVNLRNLINSLLLRLIIVLSSLLMLYFKMFGARGPILIAGFYGHCYYIILADAWSKYTWCITQM